MCHFRLRLASVEAADRVGTAPEASVGGVMWNQLITLSGGINLDVQRHGCNSGSTVLKRLPVKVDSVPGLNSTLTSTCAERF